MVGVLALGQKSSALVRFIILCGHHGRQCVPSSSASLASPGESSMHEYDERSKRYNDERLFQLVGGRKAMIESPVIQEIIADSEREDIVKVLETRFGPSARSLEPEVLAVGPDKLDEAVRLAVASRSPASFRKKLAS